jgi:hypothetical protein
MLMSSNILILFLCPIKLYTSIYYRHVWFGNLHCLSLYYWNLQFLNSFWLDQINIFVQSINFSSNLTFVYKMSDMGVPAFFRWLSKKYPSILVHCVEDKVKHNFLNYSVIYVEFTIFNLICLKYWMTLNPLGKLNMVLLWVQKRSWKMATSQMILKVDGLRVVDNPCPVPILKNCTVLSQSYPTFCKQMLNY